jgi:hypothetical protein
VTTNGNKSVPVPADLGHRSPAQAAWEQRVLGADIFEISAKLGLPVREVSELLASHLQVLETQPTQQKGFYRALCIAQLDKLLATYLEIALMKEVTIERIRSGEAVAEEDYRYPLACAHLCIAAIKLKSELLGLKLSELVVDASPRSAMDWLATQREFIQKVVAQAPSDTLDLPSRQLDARSVENLQIDPCELDEPDIEFCDPAPAGQRQGSQSRASATNENVLSQAEQSRAERRRRFEQWGFDAL